MTNKKMSVNINPKNKRKKNINSKTLNRNPKKYQQRKINKKMIRKPKVLLKVQSKVESKKLKKINHKQMKIKIDD
jgi:hypothetical protein